MVFSFLSFTLFLPLLYRNNPRKISFSDHTRLSLPTYRAPAGTIDPKTIESPKFRFRKSEPETKERTGDDESIAVPAIYDVELEPTDRSGLVRERTLERRSIIAKVTTGRNAAVISVEKDHVRSAKKR